VCEAKKKDRCLVVLCVIRSYHTVCPMCVCCLLVVRGSGWMGPNRAAASALSEEREGERRASFSDDTFFFNKLSKAFLVVG